MFEQWARRAVTGFEARRRAHWRARVLATGADRTERSAGASCLVLAPHPDDETIGCGATIARKRAAGTPVRVVVAADGRSSHRSAVLDPDELAAVRAEEVVAACAELGVDSADVVRLGLEDGTLRRRSDELIDRLREELERADPDEVLVASSHDWHDDHRALNAALRTALGRRRPTVRVLEYPVWFWMHGPWDADAGGPWPRRRPLPFALGVLRPTPPAELVATAGHLADKRRALTRHRSQTTNLTGEPEWAVLDDEFVASFLLPFEPFFPLDDGR